MFRIFVLAPPPPFVPEHYKVFVMDTAAFPFFKGEVYHQFHNDMTEDYGRKYNDLRNKYAGDGRMEETGCPERFL